MQDDVTDGVAALVKDGVANEQCVCVVGASYGGYVALAGAAFTPDVYRCAASISGVSDLQAMLAFERTQTGDESNTLAYWKDQLGSATDPELARISPVHSAANVKAAVLIMHGSEDTIVPVKQSEAMAKALDAAGKRYRFVKLPGEDHWLSAGSTRTQMLTELESFLDENLGSACGKGGQDE